MNTFKLAVLIAAVITAAFYSTAAASGPKSGKHISLQEKLERVQNEIQKDNSRPPDSEEAGRQEEAAANPVSAITFTSAVKMICGLIFIIVLAVVSIRLLKKFQKSSLLGHSGKNKGGMEVMDTCYLGNDQKIVSVKLPGATAILGVTAHGISLIKELPAEVDIPPVKAVEQTPHAEFTDNLNQFLSRFKKPKTVAETLKEL